MMKYLNILRRKIIFSIITVGTLTSCELEIQESYNFQPETVDIATFENQTAWEWIQTQQALSEGSAKFSNNKFNYLVKAIEVTGTQEIYETGTANKTFFLLNNSAFTDSNNGIFKNVILNNFKIIDDNGTPDNKDDDFSKPVDEVFKNVDIEELRDLLSYQVLNNNYVDQLEALPVALKVSPFQTLRPGDKGIIHLRRTFRYRIEGSIDTNFTRNSFVRPNSHNYAFKNGIGHLMNIRFYK